MIEMMDYLIVTYNDIDTIAATIDSIRRQANVNRLIVVISERSDDGTYVLVYNHPDVDIVLTENVGLAYARKIGIQAVETDWFIFVDGDVVLSDSWAEEMYCKMSLYSKIGVGAFFGYLYRNEEYRKDLEEYAETRNIPRRMFTHNTIIKTELVKDWAVDDDVNSYEDYLITQHIINKGYMCYNVDVFSLHNHAGTPWKQATWAGAGAKLTGYYTSIYGPMRNLFISVGGGLKRSIRQRKLFFLKDSIVISIGTVWGYVRANSYNRKK